MNIGIDAIAAAGRGGNSTYSRELIQQLLSQDNEDTFYLFSFLHELRKKSSFSGVGIAKRKQLYIYVSKPYYPFSNSEQVNTSLLRFAARLGKIDLLHFTNPLNFVPGSYKSVVTVHDLAPLHGGQWAKESSYKAFPGIMQKITDYADAIIAVSEYTKKDLIETLGIAPERITVIYEGASDSFYPEAAVEELANAFGIRNYVLYTGQLQPRKNLLLLIRAWSLYKKSSRSYDSSAAMQTKLVLAGGARDSGYRLAVEECIREEGVIDSVVLTGSVDDATLRRLYSTARCFIYPSLFEGFGLPVLEALQCGTPVITSCTTSLPEVAGDAGLLIDPEDPDALARALEKMLNDHALRESLQNKALAQAARFSWEKTASETLALYHKIQSPSDQ